MAVATAAGNTRVNKVIFFKFILIKCDSVLATVGSEATVGLEATVAGKNNLNHFEFDHKIKAKFVLGWVVATEAGNIRANKIIF